MPEEASYLLLEVAVLLTVVSLAGGLFQWRVIIDRQILTASGGLLVLWWIVDIIAVRLHLWSFPQGGTLPIRLLGLPVEEYLLFGIHTFICLLLVVVLDTYLPD